MVLVLCERSQVVTLAFRDAGFEAYSVDLLPCMGSHKEWHLQADALSVALSNPFAFKIAFPPCDKLCVSGAWTFKKKIADGSMYAAATFFLNLEFLCDVVENSVGVMSTLYRKPDQIIHPWQFGHGEKKRTCLWLNNDLPLLRPTNIVSGRAERVLKMPGGKNQAFNRAVTYPGIADAMVSQWFYYVTNKNQYMAKSEKEKSLTGANEVLFKLETGIDFPMKSVDSVTPILQQLEKNAVIGSSCAVLLPGYAMKDAQRIMARIRAYSLISGDGRQKPKFITGKDPEGNYRIWLHSFVPVNHPQ